VKEKGPRRSSSRVGRKKGDGMASFAHREKKKVHSSQFGRGRDFLTLGRKEREILPVNIPRKGNRRKASLSRRRGSSHNSYIGDPHPLSYHTEKSVFPRIFEKESIPWREPLSTELEKGTGGQYA